MQRPLNQVQYAADPDKSIYGQLYLHNICLRSIYILKGLEKLNTCAQITFKPTKSKSVVATNRMVFDMFCHFSLSGATIVPSHSNQSSVLLHSLQPIMEAAKRSIETASDVAENATKSGLDQPQLRS